MTKLLRRLRVWLRKRHVQRVKRMFPPMSHELAEYIIYGDNLAYPVLTRTEHHA